MLIRISAPARDQRLDRVGAVEPVRPEVGVVPDVLADRDAQAPAAKVDRRDLGRRLEVAPFVEDVVGGQQRLAHHRGDPAVLDQRGRVGDAAPGRASRASAREIRPAARGAGRRPRAGVPRAGGRPCQRLQRRAGRGQEGRALEQVLGRVARERQLRTRPARSAPRRAASACAAAIRRRLPSKSPMVGLIWPSATITPGL